MAGVPTPDETHATRVAEAALELVDALKAEVVFDAPILVGIDSGEVTAGVFGGERKDYRVWGEPMDLARLLGSQTRSGTVLVSPSAHRALRLGFIFGKADLQEIPGRGQMKTFPLKGSD